jgi:hypothetical protein
MTLQLELNPKTEARLAAEAAQHGMAPEAYALKLLEGALPPHVYATGTGRMTKQDLEDLTRELTTGSENLPTLPPKVNDRESYYEDRW